MILPSSHCFRVWRLRPLLCFWFSNLGTHASLQGKTSHLPPGEWPRFDGAFLLSFASNVLWPRLMATADENPAGALPGGVPRSLIGDLRQEEGRIRPGNLDRLAYIDMTAVQLQTRSSIGVLTEQQKRSDNHQPPQ
jgi:hypothetical protein